MEPKEKYEEMINSLSPGDKIDLNTGYSCDRGIFLNYEKAEKKMVWESCAGGDLQKPDSPI